MNDVKYWKENIDSPICGYYDGSIEILQDVKGNDEDIQLLVNGRWTWSLWCTLDTDEDRWVHPSRKKHS